MCLENKNLWGDKKNKNHKVPTLHGLTMHGLTALA